VDHDAPPGLAEEVWSAPLADGSLAVLAFNKGPVPRQVKITWEMLGLDASRAYRVRDLWAHKDQPLPAKNEVSALVAPHGVVVLKLSKL
jgi:alpha-galactosidase